jgi:hypothetical protein
LPERGNAEEISQNDGGNKSDAGRNGVIINPESRSFNKTNVQNRIEVRFESDPGSLPITNLVRGFRGPTNTTPWKLTITVPHGGVKVMPEDARENPAALLKAPGEGYEEMATVEGAVSLWGGRPIERVEFYFFVGEPRVYGKAALMIGPWDEDVWTDVMVETSVNPDGGRSLFE